MPRPDASLMLAGLALRLSPVQDGVVGGLLRRGGSGLQDPCTTEYTFSASHMSFVHVNCYSKNLRENICTIFEYIFFTKKRVIL
jgi:hypothetical protein